MALIIVGGREAGIVLSLCAGFAPCNLSFLLRFTARHSSSSSSCLSPEIENKNSSHYRAVEQRHVSSVYLFKMFSELKATKPVERWNNERRTCLSTNVDELLWFNVSFSNRRIFILVIAVTYTTDITHSAFKSTLPFERISRVLRSIKYCHFIFPVSKQTDQRSC